jgi:hypothetical protein
MRAGMTMFAKIILDLNRVHPQGIFIMDCHVRRKWIMVIPRALGTDYTEFR